MIKHSVKVVAITAPSPGAPAKLPSTRPVVRRPASFRQVPNSPSMCGI